jgi:hypothetical protein
MLDNRRLLFLASLLLTGVLLVSCGNDGQGILLEDRFSDHRSGWGTDSEREFDRGYQDGEYFFELYEPDWLVWAGRGKRFSDVDIDVEVRQTVGSNDGNYGLLCRFSEPTRFYYFSITGDGYYAILKVDGDVTEVLTGLGYLPSRVILTDGQPNSIRAVCEGDVLTLFVNGEQVARVRDDALPRGDVGMAVGAGPSGSIRVHFDDIVISDPGAQVDEEAEE